MSAVVAVNKPNEFELVPQADRSEMRKLDEVRKSASRELVQAEIEGDDMSKGLIVARAMKTLRTLLTPKIMADVMTLQGTPLGFRTDKDTSGGYSVEVVRDVLIQALIRGVKPVGNQMNIIAGNLYVTKEGFERLLKEFSGLRNLKFQLGVPVTVNGGALVPAIASWTLNGVKDSLVCDKTESSDFRIPVKVNSMMGTDAIHGKALSKLYRRIYQRITGSEIMSDADADGMADTVQASVVEVVTEGTAKNG